MIERFVCNFKIRGERRVTKVEELHEGVGIQMI